MEVRSARRPLFVVALMLLAAAAALRLSVPQAPVWVGGLILCSAMAVTTVALSLRARSCHDAPPAVQRRYTRDMGLAMGTYMLLLTGSMLALRVVDTPLLRVLLALAPVVPIALIMRAMVRFVRGVDELQQRIEFESVCIAAALVSLAFMTGGFLQMARVIDIPGGVAMLWVFPLMCGTYGVAKAVVARRYR